MSVRMAGTIAALVLSTAVSSPVQSRAQAVVDAALFTELTWRHLGPFRGGRATAAAGIPSQPNVFLVGTANGGAWKTTDAGRTWRPIFDDQPTGSIGSIAIAANAPDVIYVGSGAAPVGMDAPAGNGIYRSDNAGRTWARLGLFDSYSLPRIAVDPRNENRLFVAALGAPFGGSPERGVFRSENGGRTFENVLFADTATGAVDVLLDPTDSTIVYAALWQFRGSPWDAAVFSGAGTNLQKSTDGGAHWRQIGRGLPTAEDDGLGRINLAVSPANGRHLYALVTATRRGGLYASTDGGESWTLLNDDGSVAGGETAHVSVAADAAGRDVIYLTGAAAWRSLDGGATFVRWRTDPDGADYEHLWINPSVPGVALMTGGRGAIVTVNDGQSWSSDDNQPTGQAFQVSTSSVYPYRVCGAFRGATPGCLPIRSDRARIGSDDWQPVGTAPNGVVAPDPLDSDVVYSGEVARYDRRTTELQDVSPPGDRPGRGLPLLFAPTDGRTLYFATSALWKTTTGGQTWLAISPDSRVNRRTCRRVLRATARRLRRIGAGAAPFLPAVGPSPVDSRVVWTGTDDGLIHVTRDGGATWRNVTPPARTAWTAWGPSSRRTSIRTAPTRPPTRGGSATGGLVCGARAIAGRPGRTSLRACPQMPRCPPCTKTRCAAGCSSRRRTLRVPLVRRWRELAAAPVELPPARSGIRRSETRHSWQPATGAGFGARRISPLRQITPVSSRSTAFLFRPATAWRARTTIGRPAMSPDVAIGGQPARRCGVLLSARSGRTKSGDSRNRRNGDRRSDSSVCE